MRFRRFVHGLTLGLLIFCAGRSAPSAATLTVGGTGGTYATIQEALDAAASGDTILVAAGSYAETSLVITKPVTLAGAGSATTFLGAAASSVDIAADGVTFRGFTMVGYSSAAILHGSGNLVEDIVVTAGAVPFSVHGTNNTIRRCRISGTSIPMPVYNTGAVIEDNVFTNNSLALPVYGPNDTALAGNVPLTLPAGAVIRRNTFQNNTGGPLLYAPGNRVYHNNFLNSPPSSYGVINTWDNDAGEGNHWSDYAGVDDGSGMGRLGEARVSGDGIGDTNVPHLGLDWYPVLQADRWLNPVIQSFDESRSICEGSFATGDGFSVARGRLAARGLTLGAGVATITPAALLDAEIFVIGPLGSALSSGERCMLETFVNHGGALLDVRNMFLPSVFGVQQTTFGGSGQADFVNASDADVAQILAGVSSPILLGANSALTIGEGIPFLEDFAGHGPTGLVFPSTSGRKGRAVIIGDEEIFMNSFGAYPGAAHGLNANNQNLLLNVFAYLSAAPGLDAGGRAALEACVSAAPNGAPMAANDSVMTDEDMPATFTVLANDVDPDGDALSAAVLTQPAHGALVSNTDGSFTYTSAQDFNGQDSFTYKANDGHADSDVAIVNITVRSINDPPLASAGGPYNVDEGGSVALNGSATDVDGDSLTFAWDLDNDGSFESPGAAPAFSAAGLDGPSTRTVQFRATDPAGGLSSAMALVTIANIAPAIDAGSDQTVFKRDVFTLGPLTIADPGAPDSHTATIEWGDGSSSGAIISGRAVTATHAFGQTGTFEVVVTVTDDDGAGGRDTLAITVLNRPPAAGGDSYQATEDVPLIVAAPGVLANDTDLDADAVVAELVGAPANGAIALNADGSFSYAPNANFTGSDGFSYRASDGTAASAVTSVTIIVAPVNDPPSAVDDSAVVEWNSRSNFVNVLANDSFAPDSGETLRVSAITAPAYGSSAIAPNGLGVVYAPRAGFFGTDTFTYTVTDSNGGVDIGTVVMTVRRIAADLGISKSPAAGERIVRQPFEYTLLVRNNGPDSASQVIVKDSVADGVVVNSAFTTRGTCTANPSRFPPGTFVRCEIGTLAIGESVQIVLNVTPTKVGVITNRAQVSAQTTDPAPSNNSSNTSQIRVRPLTANMSIFMTASASSPSVGSTLNYTLSVRNSGPDTAPRVTVNDYLPHQLEFVSASASQGTCDTAAGHAGSVVVVCDLGPLAKGGLGTVTIQTIVRARGGIQNQASVAGGAIDPSPNHDMARVLVIAQ